MTNSTFKSQFELQNFFPYQVRLLYRAVSDSVQKIYGAQFGLTVSEWRVMVVLKPGNVMSASEIVERSSMTSVHVSRAICGLREAGLLKRDINGEDKRKAALRLTDRGVEMFNALVPLVLALETELLEGLSEEEVKTLLLIMGKVRNKAEKLVEWEAAQTSGLLE